MNLTRLTLPMLLAQWARIVDYTDRLQFDGHDYHADVDVRHEIASRVRSRPTSAETREMLAELDAHFRETTVPSPACIHGDARAAAEGWTPQREWYYWRVPAGGGA